MGFAQSYNGTLFDQGPDLQGVAANATAFAKLPVGATYQRLMLRFLISGTPATLAQIQAQVSRVRLVVDAETKVDVSGADLVYLINYYRAGAVDTTSGILPIHFSRPWMAALENEDAPSWGMLGINSFSLEVTLAAGATITTIQSFYETTSNEALADHFVIQKLSRSYGSAGLETINDLPTSPDWLLYAMHIVTSTGINTIELLADSSRVLIGPPSVLNKRLTVNREPRTLQTGYQPLDLIHRGRNIDALRLDVATLQLKIDWAAAPNAYSILLEYAKVQPMKGAVGAPGVR